MRWSWAIFCFVGATLWAQPVVPGLLHERHGLDAAGQGRVLIEELRCAWCHAGPVQRKLGPDLSGVGARVDAGYLRRFLLNPHQEDPGTQMPDVLAAVPADEREATADVLTHYLTSLSAEKFSRANVDGSMVGAGKKLFQRVGCVTCHSPGQGVGLKHVPAKYGLDSLSAFLFQPHHARPAGRMPDMNLTRDEARSIAAFLLGAKELKVTELPPNPAKVAAGKAVFRSLNCTSCHKLPNQKSQLKLPMAKLRAGRGCLAEQPDGVPDFHLSAFQRDAMGKALTGIQKPLPDRLQVQHTMTAFNCIACHTRDGAGGVSNAMFQHFGTDEEGLGNPGRIPPTLDGVGAKLRPEWLRKVLFDGAAVRPYMHTRMPQFGEANLRHLPGLFEKVDSLPVVELPEPKREDRRRVREAGHLLVGDQGLNCVACHNFNGKPSPGLKGVDLLNSFERLQPSWFAHFMRNPQKFRPGIVMPNFWPDGKAVRADVLEGQTEAQLQALWHYFSLGRSARDPSGIRSVGTDLVVSDRTRVYRGRSRVAGYRGIAVGFPGGMNYAFNAQNGTLSALWQGEFVSVFWGGQGAGNFNPKGRAIELAQDVTFYRLAKADAPWPLRPQMTKENPVNPDPLYPRNRGYRFGGYQLDADGVPTFLYRTGTVSVADRSQAVVSDRLNGLVRTLQLETPKAETVYVRVLTGKVQRLAPRQYGTESLKVWLPETEVLLRGAGETKELLMKLNLPKGKSEWGIRYELLR
ncbi:MAG: hypothetical protein H8E27_11605 [Verrucomicrobia subdivision 3 bacterium]|nr:hypothetical protein [Limisphaerales bacterium]